MLITRKTEIESKDKMCQPVDELLQESLKQAMPYHVSLNWKPSIEKETPKDQKCSEFTSWVKTEKNIFYNPIYKSDKPKLSNSYKRKREIHNRAQRSTQNTPKSQQNFKKYEKIIYSKNIKKMLFNNRAKSARLKHPDRKKIIPDKNLESKESIHRENFERFNHRKSFQGKVGYDLSSYSEYLIHIKDGIIKDEIINKKTKQSSIEKPIPVTNSNSNKKRSMLIYKRKPLDNLDKSELLQIKSVIKTKKRLGKDRMQTINPQKFDYIGSKTRMRQSPKYIKSYFLQKQKNSENQKQFNFRRKSHIAENNKHKQTFDYRNSNQRQIEIFCVKKTDRLSQLKNNGQLIKKKVKIREEYREKIEKLRSSGYKPFKNISSSASNSVKKNLRKKRISRVKMKEKKILLGSKLKRDTDRIEKTKNLILNKCLNKKYKPTKSKDSRIKTIPCHQVNQYSLRFSTNQKIKQNKIGSIMLKKFLVKLN